MEGKRFSENLSSNKALSDDGSNNFSPSLNVSNDFLGIGKTIQAYFDCKKYKISITERNVKSIYHLVRKRALTTQIEAKDFIDEIFKLYKKVMGYDHVQDTLYSHGLGTHGQMLCYRKCWNLLNL